MLKHFENRIGVVMGTRPEVIKMAPVIHHLLQACVKHSFLRPIIFVSGQHKQLLYESLRLFNIEPDFDLCMMKDNQQLAELTAQLISGFDKLFSNTAPGLVLVHGDTTTAYAACLAAFYRKIPVGHIEAGLRSGIPNSPFPEEFNRRGIDSISSLYFAPTGEAVINLINEGIPAHKVFHTGNTVIDTLLHVVIKQKRKCEQHISAVWKQFREIIQQHRVILVTSHRRENSLGSGLINICRAVLEIVKNNSDIVIVFPVHPNPNVSRIVYEMLENKSRIVLLPPLNYFAFSYLLSTCTLVLTDSGGIQEEAPALKKPVFVLRDTCERPEVIRSGGGKLVGTSTTTILSSVHEVLNNQNEFDIMANSGSPYGDGHASERIVQSLVKYFAKNQLEVA